MFQAPSPSRDAPSHASGGVEAPEILHRILAEALELVERDRPGVQARLCEALELLGGAPSNTGLGNTRTPRRVRALCPWQVRKVTTHVDSHLGELVRVRDLAALTRLTTGYFSRAFRVSFGTSPQAYLIRRRIEWAERMMLESDEPLAQIAVACGLCDQSYLSRLFRQLRGVSPADWRRARRSCGVRG